MIMQRKVSKAGGGRMILLSKKNKEKSTFILNHKRIERVIPLKDTILLLIDGKKIIVNESPDEIIKKIIDFESEISYMAINKKEVQKL
jgi:flagellar protein FlbD